MLCCVQLTGRTLEELPVRATLFFYVRVVAKCTPSQSVEKVVYNHCLDTMGKLAFISIFQMIIIIVLRLFDRLIHCLLT